MSSLTQSGENRLDYNKFRYASPCLWNQLPSSLRQHHSSLTVTDLPVPAPTRSHSVNAPLIIHNSLSRSLSPQNLHLSPIFSIVDPLPASGLTPRTFSLTEPFLLSIQIFGRPFLKRFALCYQTVVCLSCLSCL